MINKTLIYAHRGFSSIYPENTMIAFEKAAQLGADGIELDVQICKSGEIVVIHDEYINRTCEGRGLVANITYDELLKFNFNCGFYEYNDVKIPLLKEVLELIKDNDMQLNIELKNTKVPYIGMEKKVISLCKEYNVLDRIVLSSFNHKSMTLAKEIDNDVETALLYSEIMYNVSEYARMCKADSIHPEKSSIDLNDTLECNVKGIKIRVWTVDEPKNIKRFMNNGINSIITNTPDVAIEIRDKNK